ncbi:MAG: ABC transporter ATP-binding protein [Myxococcota bacterium]
MPICQLARVSKDYGTGQVRVRALDAVDLTVEPGEFTVFSGPSGSGKTTLLNLIGCLDLPTEGTIRIDGTDVTTLSARALAGLRASRIGFVFQSFNLIPVLSALENVELALQLAHDARPDRRRLATEALASVGLGDLVHRRPGQLSGGQQQRVAIARALVKRPALIIADEPTANLDSKNGEAIVAIMRRMNVEQGMTFLFSTHDPMVMGHAQRVVRLVDGRITEDHRAAVTA